jgi:hypothetical protein
MKGVHQSACSLSTAPSETAGVLAHIPASSIQSQPTITACTPCMLSMTHTVSTINCVDFDHCQRHNMTEQGCHHCAFQTIRFMLQPTAVLPASRRPAALNNSCHSLSVRHAPPGHCARISIANSPAQQRQTVVGNRWELECQSATLRACCTTSSCCCPTLLPLPFPTSASGNSW